MPNEKFTCPRCFKRCGNAGALKTHMNAHKQPEPKSGSLMKRIVKREPVKSESKQKPKEAIELKPHPQNPATKAAKANYTRTNHRYKSLTPAPASRTPKVPAACD